MNEIKQLINIFNKAKLRDDCELLDMHLTLLQNVGPAVKRNYAFQICSIHELWFFQKQLLKKNVVLFVLSSRLVIPLCYFTSVFFEQPISSTEYISQDYLAVCSARRCCVLP